MGEVLPENPHLFLQYSGKKIVQDKILTVIDYGDTLHTRALVSVLKLLDVTYHRIFSQVEGTTLTAPTCVVLLDGPSWIDKGSNILFC